MYRANTGNGLSRSAHRNSANRQFYNQMKSSSEFKRSIDNYFGYDVMEYMQSGKGALKNPSPDWVWHHSAQNPGSIDLIPKAQHWAPELQSILHPGPNGAGGFGLYY